MYGIYIRVMIDWSPTTNAVLKERYGFGFERVVVAMEAGAVFGERAHPNPERYGHQRQTIVDIDGYVWVVSFVIDGETIFFKTMYPSRKANRDFQRG
jgi:hypothetical protein